MTEDNTAEALEGLAATWNEKGRAYYTDYGARLAKSYGDGDRDVDLELEDPRDEALGDRVVRAVIDLNAQGNWQRARELFDPAFAPLMGWIKETKDDLRFVTILAPDELLVYRGRPWLQDGTAFHLSGGAATPIADVRGIARTRSRDYLVLARGAGLEIRDARVGVAALNGLPIATIPWPDKKHLAPSWTLRDRRMGSAGEGVRDRTNRSLGRRDACRRQLLSPGDLARVPPPGRARVDVALAGCTRAIPSR